MEEIIERKRRRGVGGKVHQLEALWAALRTICRVLKFLNNKGANTFSIKWIVFVFHPPIFILLSLSFTFLRFFSVQSHDIDSCCPFACYDDYHNKCYKTHRKMIIIIRSVYRETLNVICGIAESLSTWNNIIVHHCLFPSEQALGAEGVQLEITIDKCIQSANHMTHTHSFLFGFRVLSQNSNSIWLLSYLIALKLFELQLINCISASVTKVCLVFLSLCSEHLGNRQRPIFHK